MHIGFTSHLWLKIASCVSSHPCMRTCGWCLELSVFFLVSFVFYLVSPFLLPALPDVHLSAQREVHVQTLVLLQLGERGHIRLRHTPHRKATETGSCTRFQPHLGAWWRSDIPTENSEALTKATADVICFLDVGRFHRRFCERARDETLVRRVEVTGSGGGHGRT